MSELTSSSRGEDRVKENEDMGVMYREMKERPLGMMTGVKEVG